jgi:putative acetyltransferase
MLTIRPELESDREAVRAVNTAAFPTPQEAHLVDALRDTGKAVLSLVAAVEGRVVGHILFSPVTVEDGPQTGLGLAPVAVAPEYQSQGIGSGLIRAGLDAAQRLGYTYVVVLGDPAYYSRFGFETASHFGLANEYEADEHFMALALTPNGLRSVSGLVRYAPEFGLVS